MKKKTKRAVKPARAQNKNATIDWWSRIATVFEIFGIVIALATFLASQFPDKNPFNKNYLEKANAGHLESQIFLADHYLKVGELKESIYWYEIVSMKDSIYRAKALNNLACINLKYGLFDETLYDYKDSAAALLLEAASYESIEPIKNLYLLLCSSPDVCFTSIDANEELSRAIESLKERNEYTEELEQLKSEWKYLGTYPDEVTDEDLKEMDRYVIVPKMSYSSKLLPSERGYPVWQDIPYIYAQEVYLPKMGATPVDYFFMLED